MVDTVGQVGRPGEHVQKVISVGMLSEGWDAKTVTHIMGLRAFSSQLLCEQAVGRGLRRTSYDVDPDTGLFEQEYVNVFGVPFTFMPHEAGDGPPPPPQPPKDKIEVLPDRQPFEIRWPNVIRVEHVCRPTLTLDTATLPALVIDAAQIAQVAEVAPIISGKPDLSNITSIELESLGREFRLQKLVFEAARDVYDQMKPSWNANKEYLLAQLIGLSEKVLRSDKIVIQPELFNQDELRRRIVLALSMQKVVQHIWAAIRFENTLGLEPVFDGERPLRSTGDMLPWYTGKPNVPTIRSQINRCVVDSTWEASEAFELDRNEHVIAWAKNDHLGFEIVYSFDGVIRKYRPDFLVRLADGTTLVLEVKGRDSQQDQTKRQFLDEWVRAVNQHGGFGRWRWGVSMHIDDLSGILAGTM